MSASSIPNVVSIAGIDPSGGAGIYADLKAFSALGAYGCGVVAALTEAIGEDIAAADFAPIEKTSFSAMSEPTFVEALEKLGRRTVIIAGIEAHVCVQQTVIDLLEKGYTVFVANDGIASRNNTDKKINAK